MTKSNKLTKALQSKGYMARIIWVNPRTAMDGLDGFTIDEEGPNLDVPGHSRWFGYNYTQALENIEKLPTA